MSSVKVLDIIGKKKDVILFVLTLRLRSGLKALVET